jgi:4-hydroxysphinganine ceramide fatty acyl 2-hydroxylase
MPPLLFFALSYPFTNLAHAVFPTAMANGVISGAFVFCKLLPFTLVAATVFWPTAFPDILYDCMHYALHHSRLPQYMREMKKYHLAHHYKNFELGFGVTSE